MKMTNAERKARYDALESLGIKCDTIVNPDGEPVITRWTDERPEMTWPEILAAAAKVIVPKSWPSVAEFYGEFFDSEIYRISTSGSPAVVVARDKLMAWRGEVLANDSRIVAGMSALIAAGIIDESRRDTILGK